MQKLADLKSQLEITKMKKLTPLESKEKKTPLKNKIFEKQKPARILPLNKATQSHGKIGIRP